MPENDMIKNNISPDSGPRPSEGEVNELDLMLQQLGVPPLDSSLPTDFDPQPIPAGDEGDTAQSAEDDADTVAAEGLEPVPEGDDGETDTAVDDIISADAPVQETSWLDNLLAFAESSSAPVSESATAGSGIASDDEHDENSNTLSPSISEPLTGDEQDTDGEPVPTPTESDAGPSDNNGPEEISGPNWQDAFIISDSSDEADAETADTGSLIPEPEDAEPVTHSQDELSATSEYIPAPIAAQSSSDTDAVVEEQIYSTAAPDKKSGKKQKEFRIETDYRHDFGEYDRIHPIKINKRHKSGCLGGILYFLFILVTGSLLGGMLWLAAVDVLAINKPANDVEITIPDNYTIDEVADILHANGLIKYKPLFKIFADFSNAEEKIEPGVYSLKTSYDYRALVSCMRTYSGYRVVTEVTIPEGYNMFQMFALLEENGVCTQDELWDAAENGDFDYDFLDSSSAGDKLRLEGYLFPDTYEFYVNDDAERVLNKMLDNFDSKFTEEYRLRAEELGYSIHDIISIAAMVEKETGVDSERATIASVIYNRLNSGEFPYLQIDATIIYATYITGEEFSTALDNPYNTYMYEGLPGPITNPGIASIRAALYPETTNYYYYAATVDFTTRFFSRYDDFVAFIESDEFQSSN